MFEFIRNNQKIMQFVLLLFIAPAFALFGLEGYSTASADANALAIVGDYPISQEEFDQVKRERIEEARAQSGDNFDPKVFESPEINRQLLDTLVLQYLLQQSVQKQYLTASDKALAEDIARTPLFQVDGKFDLDTYKRELAARGLTPNQHEANVRFGLARNQVLDPVLRASFFPETLKTQLDDVQLAGRVVRVKSIDLAPYAAKVDITDEQIAAYYDANKSQFMAAQQADVEYVVLSPETIKSKIVVGDADIASYYEQNKARFSTPEERRARHILMDAEKEGASETELKAAAEKVLAELKANPGKFAELAKQYSIDPGSAAQGGDLGFFNKGAMVPEFEQAVFSQKTGALSDLVKSQFGYHIIEVTDIRGGEVQSLDEVKDQIANEIKGQKMTAQYADAQGRFAELVYEGGQSFDNVVQALGVSTSSFNGLTQAAPNAPDILKDAKVMAEIFSADSIESKNNTKAVQVGESMVSARIVNFTPATARPIEEVRNGIVTRLTQDEATRAALKDADALAAKLDADKPAEGSEVLADFSDAKTVSALGAEGLPGLVAQSVLNTGVSELPKAKVIGLGAAGYAVAWVQNSAPSSEIKAKADPQVVQYYENIAGQVYQEALLLAARDAMKKRVEVEIKKTF
ncbi:SurA N-terminal domain-containing protein [Limnobacter parvus]|uniref:Periplasmic chaperone PpiD n=1 Tax=Limnobacter parvus TaxID=2939690 RepID=A0ABT1XJV8_9BURK|nr:SurA N-terminal domain-containing protein [Limnobacter parvus]MCR2747576.1 SurA N-terminal domain-containing protein [Limnobacter parvus]